jgi:hypothetical protein
LIVLPVTEQTQDAAGACQQTTTLHLIDLLPDDLVARGAAAVPSMVQRALPVADKLYVAGTLHLASFNVSQRDQPVLENQMVLGDPSAPVECIEFTEVLGNSPDAQSGGVVGDVWDEGYGDYYEPSGTGGSSVTGCP